MRLLGSESGIVFYFWHRNQYGGTEITEELLCRKKEGMEEVEEKPRLFLRLMTAASVRSPKKSNEVSA